MIELKGICKKFGQVEILKGVDLKVEEGETVALMGPSGSGKSLLLKIVSGLIPPDKGEVIINGEKVTSTRGKILDRIREHIGMIFQSNALFDSMNVFENVAFALRNIKGMNHDEIAKRVREALNMVKLGQIEFKRISELSGGMKKRVGIARAIVANPRILLTDDPTAGLDPVTAQAIVNLLQELRTKFKSSGIVVTTAVNTACQVADKIAFLYDGKIIEEGRLEKLKLSQCEPVKKFIESAS